MRSLLIAGKASPARANTPSAADPIPAERIAAAPGPFGSVSSETDFGPVIPGVFSSVVLIATLPFFHFAADKLYRRTAAHRGVFVEKSAEPSGDAGGGE